MEDTLIPPTPLEPSSGQRSKKQIFGYLIAAAMFALLIYFANLRELAAVFTRMTFASIVYLLLISALLLYLSALKWHYFLEYLGSTVSVVRLCGIYLIGYFVNLLVPSFIGGDVARSWYVGKKSGQHEAMIATILERYTGMVAMVILAFCFVWITDQATAEIRWAVCVITAGLIVATAAALSDTAIHVVERLPLLSKIAKQLKKVQGGLRLAMRNKALLLKAMIVSFLFHTFTVVNTVAAGFVVGWYDPPVWDLFVVLPLILLIGALPITPSGLGIQEGAFYYFLGGLGATPAQALGVALVLRAKSYLLAIAGWGCWIFEKRQH